MRLVVVGFSHECNSFNLIKNKLNDVNEVLYEDEIIKKNKGIRTPIGGFLNITEKIGAEVIPIISLSFPHGPITNEAYNFYKEKLVEGVNNAGKVDGVLLGLHGSMVAEGIPNGDGEGDILKTVREIVGHDTLIMNTFDLHSTVTKLKIENSNAIFGYDTNPHVDGYERGIEAAETMVKTLKGKIRPTMAMHREDMILQGVGCSTWSARGNVLPKVPHLWDSVRMDAADRILPLSILFKLARFMETKEKVLNVSISAGFPFSDVPEAGPSVTVVTDNDLKLAEELAKEASGLMWNIRHLFVRQLISADEAVVKAMKLEGPTILTDVADDPGAGSYGDSTGVLKALIERDAHNATIVMHDPEVVKTATKSGIGELMKIKLGAKFDKRSGDPLEVSGKVMALTSGRFIMTGPMGVGREMDAGMMTILRIGGIDVVITQRRVAPNDAQIFRSIGIEPSEKKILVIKSTQHYRASYEPLVKEIIEVDAPAIAPTNLTKIRDWYKKVRRPIFPLD
jgi:microcystin degradation protein MlrC